MLTWTQPRRDLFGGGGGGNGSGFFFFSLFPASSTAGTYPYKVQISLQSRSTAPAVL